ncbi:PAAR domain-containing protein [Acinetobacter rongchengensis]|uniref:PAAR domain-containing protein n=1 Tax=Acinetobacter rongchengensis TaxID=2419601 RepID=A0A3A8FBL9_9GAMM|nr:PAAR domain-containing protein [Acinetobacter rongchengensis]RKG38601.1 PAAR domain-containing protein [Acinetobacter rongchengensis]
MKALITRGCTTNHGGIIHEADDSFIVQGKAVHLDGMKHFCPQCKVISYAIASNTGFMMVGSRTIVGDGDSSTCGAKYIKNQDLVVRDGGINIGTRISHSNELPKQNEVFDEQIIAVDQNSQYLSNTTFYIETVEGKIYQGMTDFDGKTPRITTNVSSELRIWLGDDAELMINKE